MNKHIFIVHSSLIEDFRYILHMNKHIFKVNRYSLIDDFWYIFI